MTKETAVKLRPITTADEPFLRDLYASVREDEPLLAQLPAVEKAVFLAMQFIAQHRHYISHYPTDDFNILEIDGKPIGRLFLHYDKREIRIVDISLVPEFRGQKVGESLLLDLLKRAGELSLPVTLHVRQENRARRLYERLGFNAVSSRDDGYVFMEWRAR